MKSNAKPQKRCNHKEAMQFTKTQCQWCPDCGACRHEVKTQVGNMVMRWVSPKDTQKPRGRKPLKGKGKGVAAKGKGAKAVATKGAKAVTARPGRVAATKSRATKGATNGNGIKAKVAKAKPVQAAKPQRTARVLKPRKVTADAVVEHFDTEGAPSVQ